MLAFLFRPFVFRGAKVRKSERNAKEKHQFFVLHCRAPCTFGAAKGTQKRAQCKRKTPVFRFALPTCICHLWHCRKAKATRLENFSRKISSKVPQLISKSPTVEEIFLEKFSLPQSYIAFSTSSLVKKDWRNLSQWKYP